MPSKTLNASFARSDRRRVSSASLVAGGVITIAAAYLAFRNVDFAEAWTSLASGNYVWLAPAFLVLAVAIFLRVLRWRLLFMPATRPALKAATEALLIGHFFNNVLPARGGEALRVVALHARTRTSRAEALATIVVERAFDVLTLLVLLLVTVPWLPAVSWLRAAAALAVGVSLALAAAIVVLALYGVRPISFVLRPFVHLPFISTERIDHAARSVVRGLIALRSAKLGTASLALTVVSWLALGLCFWFVTLVFVPGAPPSAGILLVVATGLSLVLPSAPAGLGVFEASAILALSSFDVPTSQAFSCAVVLHAFNVVPFLVIGLPLVLVYAGRAGGGTSRHRDRRRASEPDLSVEQRP